MELDALEAYAADLLAALQPAERAELARRIAARLRQANVRRIAAQVAPDGSPFEPRRQQLRQRKGALRRSMFAKLRTARFLKARGTADAAVVAFTEQVSRIARVHQFGLRDRVNRNTSLEADYPARPLLGVSADDEALILELSAAHLAGSRA